MISVRTSKVLYWILQGVVLPISPVQAGWDSTAVADGWQIIEEVREKSIEEKHQKLRGIIGGLGPLAAHGKPPHYNGSSSRTAEQEELFRAAQGLLLSTPGHAEYFGGKIREWRAHAESLSESEQKAAYESAYANYLRQRMWAIKILQNLPSPETAGVMAGFLDDDHKRYEVTGVPYGLSNMEEAARVLISILESPPSQSLHAPEKWRQWRKEVEAGKTTFRLKGSPQTYDFDGPKDPKSPRNRKNHQDAIGAVEDRASQVDSGTKQIEPGRSKQWIWLIGGIAALLLAFTYMLWTKKQEA